MRTTLKLDEDVERMPRDAMRRSGRSFKETVNDALRAGLAHRPAPGASAPFVIEVRPMGLRDGFDPAGFNKLVDDLDVDIYLERLTKPEKPE